MGKKIVAIQIVLMIILADIAAFALTESEMVETINGIQGFSEYIVIPKAEASSYLGTDVADGLVAICDIADMKGFFNYFVGDHAYTWLLATDPISSSCLAFDAIGENELCKCAIVNEGVGHSLFYAKGVDEGVSEEGDYVLGDIDNFIAAIYLCALEEVLEVLPAESSASSDEPFDNLVFSDFLYEKSRVGSSATISGSVRNNNDFAVMGYFYVVFYKNGQIVHRELAGIGTIPAHSSGTWSTLMYDLDYDRVGYADSTIVRK